MARLYGPGPTDPPALRWTNDLGGLSTNDVEDRPVGELYGALSEEGTGLIRYLDIAIRTAAKHVLVPIGHARIDRDATPPRVRLRAATHEDLIAVPDFDPETTAVDGRYQDAVMKVHGKLYYGSRYYAHPAYDHGAIYAGESPIVGPDAPVAAESGVRPLAELEGYRVARHDRDIRGWPIDDRDRERVGEVEDLLVELAARHARYALVRLVDPARLAAVPVGYLEIADGGERLVTPSLTRDDLRLLPAYEPPLDRTQENRIHATLESRLTGDRYYQRPDFRPDSRSEPGPAPRPGDAVTPGAP